MPRPLRTRAIEHVVSARDHVRADSQVSLSLATDIDREEIYQIRHEVYAHELGQHATNHDRRLSDGLDRSNVYLVAKVQGTITGFVSITPPSAKAYSIDKYFDRTELPFVVN